MRKRAGLAGPDEQLGCQVGLSRFVVSGTDLPASRSHPGMSLAFALAAAINGSTGSRATLSFGLERTKPRRRLSGGSMILIAQGWRRRRPGTLSQKARRVVIGCEPLTTRRRSSSREAGPARTSPSFGALAALPAVNGRSLGSGASLGTLASRPVASAPLSATENRCHGAASPGRMGYLAPRTPPKAAPKSQLWLA